MRSISTVALAASVALSLLACDSAAEPTPSAKVDPAKVEPHAASQGDATPAHGTPTLGPVDPSAALPSGHPVVGAAAVASGAAAVAPALEPADADGRISLGSTGNSVAWPESWTRQPVTSGMRAVQALVPGQGEGSADAELVVFNPMGGDIEANIARWEGQFGGAGTVKNRRTVKTGAGEATLAQFSGAQEVSPEMRAVGAPAAPQGAITMLTAILPTPKGLVIFKLSGPDATVQASASAFETLVISAK